MKFLSSIWICLYLVLFVDATTVRQCKGRGTRKLNTNEVSITNCVKGPCILKKRSDVSIELKFTPDHDITELTTAVEAIIQNLGSLPFIGVDGSSACKNMFLADGVTKTKCPLKAGQEYVYRNTFNVLEIYPKLSIIVHWALQTKNNKDILCFEVPAKID